MKLFNKERKELLRENNVVRYIQYALGEIVLVVIGILIALQISAWSEERKDRKEEVYILKEILNNLKEDATLIDEITGARTKAKTSIQRMLIYLPKGHINQDTLSTDLTNFITFERYFPINNGYEILKSKGLKLSDNNLTTRISRYYDYEQKKISSSIYDIEDVVKPILTNGNGLRRFIISVNLHEKVTVVDAQNPTFQKELYTELNNFRDNNGGTLERLKTFSEVNKSLRQDIEAELEKILL